MKGHELYSWSAAGEWRFALLTGTNRLKTMDEIIAPSVTLRSEAELHSRLAQLATGDEIVWMVWTDNRLALPPKPMIEAVVQVCQQFDLQLTIAP
jgi:hypothetical protein